MQIVRVALDVPLHRFFDYLAPAGEVLTAADIGVRLAPSVTEIKVGVVTALIGVPLFLWLILARRAALPGEA